LINIVNGQIDINQAGSGTLVSNGGVSFSEEQGTSKSPTKSTAADTISGNQWWPYNGTKWVPSAWIYGIVKHSSLRPSMELHFANRTNSSASPIDFMWADTNQNVFIPVKLLGGTGAAGTLTLSSTSNGTKGNIIFGTTTGMNFDQANTRLGIGKVPSSIVDVTTSLNGPAGMNMTNSSSGSSAQLFYQAINDVAQVCNLGITSSGFTASGLLKSAMGRVISTGSNGLIVGNNTAAPFILVTNGITTGGQAIYIASSRRVIIGSNNNNEPLPLGNGQLQLTTSKEIYSPLKVGGTYTPFQHTASVGTPASTTETILFSDSITAGTFDTTGAILMITQTGTLNGSSTLKFYFGTAGTTSDSLEFSTGALTVTTQTDWKMITVLQRVSNTVLNYQYTLSTTTMSRSLGGTLLSMSGAQGKYTIGTGTGLALNTTKYFWSVSGKSAAGLVTNDVTADIGFAEYITPK